MIAKTSPLIIENFSIFESHFIFIDPNPKELNAIDIYKYPLELDFGMDQFTLSDMEKKNMHKLERFQLTMSCNFEKPKVGYSFKVISMGLFRLDSDDMPETHKANLLGYSALNFMISSVRGYLRNISSYYPIGPYHLPTIDMKDILGQKAKEMEKLLKKAKKKNKEAK